MSEKKENRRGLYLTLSFFALINIHAVLLCAVLLVVVKKPHRIILAILSLLFVLTVFLYPAYLLGVPQAFLTALKTLDTDRVPSALDLVKTYLRTLMGYSISNNLAELRMYQE